jgi:hypothetical protein
VATAADHFSPHHALPDLDSNTAGNQVGGKAIFVGGVLNDDEVAPKVTGEKIGDPITYQGGVETPSETRTTSPSAAARMGVP